MKNLTKPMLRDLVDLMIENAKDIEPLDLVEVFGLTDSAQDEDTLDALLEVVRTATVKVTFEGVM